MKQPGLPNEVWLEVQSFLPHDDLKSFSCASKRFRPLTLSRLFNTVSFVGDIGEISEVESYEIFQYVASGLPGLNDNVEKARGLKKYAPYIHKLNLIQWIVPDIEDLLGDRDLKLTGGKKKTLMRGVARLCQDYETIVRCAETFHLREVNIIDSTITERVHCGIICKPTVGSIKLDMFLPRVVFDSNTPLPRVSSLTGISLVAFKKSFIDFDQHMARYLGDLVSNVCGCLRSLKTRADFLPKLSWDPMVPNILFPQLEELEIITSDDDWNWETIQAMLLSPRLKVFMFEPISYANTFDPFDGDRMQAGLLKFRDLPHYVLKSMERISTYGQLFKYLPLASGQRIEEVTFIIDLQDLVDVEHEYRDHDNDPDRSDLKPLWEELQNCVTKLQEANGPLTQFSIARSEQMESYKSNPRKIIMPFEVLIGIGYELPHIVELEIPELDNVRLADFEKLETLLYLLESLVLFTSLKCLYIWSTTDSRGVTVLPTGSTEYPTRIHSSLEYISLGSEVVWKWEEEKWKMHY